MEIKVIFSKFEDYWVAEAENGAVSQGRTLEECRTYIKQAICLIEEDNKFSDKALEHLEEIITV